VRIAFITPEYITENNFHGGLANYLSRVCLALKGFGHEPLVIVGTSAGGYIEDRGIPVHRVDVTLPGHAIVQNMPVLRRLAPALAWIWQSRKLNARLSEINAAQKIDIVQYTSHTATALFTDRKIPSVVRVSGIQTLLDLGYGRKPSAVRSILHFLDIHAMKNAGCIFAPSMLIAERVRETIGRQVTVVESPFLLPPAPYDRKPFQDLLTGREYLLFFGSIGALKGVKTIAGVMDDLLNEHPGLFFVFVGKDMGHDSGSMIQHVWENAGPHRGRVLYLGIMHQEQLFPIIEGAKAVVLPSLVDNLPNTCIEAMALGKAVIGTRGASFEQLIEDGRSGFLCAVDDERSLKEAINKALLLTEGERKAIGSRAARRIERLHPDHAVRELIRLYCEVIESFRRSGEPGN
jgi:glycosyltransferase involved in cell wall biosynthesis